MAGNNRELIHDIGTNLQDRLPLEHDLPVVFLGLLADLEAAEGKLQLPPGKQQPNTGES